MEEVLRDDGYSVVSAGDGGEGLLLFQQNVSSIALVVADVVTPKMKGKELHESGKSARSPVSSLSAATRRAS